MVKRKVKKDKVHSVHRAQVRRWRAQHPGLVYKKVGGKWRWVRPGGRYRPFAEG